jgi:hypothetical protein
MLYAGYLGDRFTFWMAKRNKGIHIPEHRLPLLIIPGIIGFGGILLYGFTATNKNQKFSWWAPVMGWTLLEFTFVCALILSTTFAAEAWPKNPGMVDFSLSSLWCHLLIHDVFYRTCTCSSCWD